MKSNETEMQFEQMLQKAVVDRFDHDLDFILADKQNAQEYIASPAHEERMKKLFAPDNRRTKTSLFLKYYCRAAAVLVSLLIVGFVVLAAVPSIRDTVLNFAFEELNNVMMLGAADAEIGELRPVYVPEEYSLVEVNAGEYRLYLQYRDDKANTIEIELFKLKNEHMNAEDDDPQIYAEGPVGVYPVPGLENIQQTHKSKLVWYTDDYLGTISSAMPAEEMRKMYLSLE